MNEAVQQLRREWRFVAVLTLVGAVVSAVLALLGGPSYVSTAQVLIRQRDYTQAVFGSAGTADPVRQLATAGVLARSPSYQQAVSAAVPGSSATDIRQRLTVSVVDGTDALQLAATGSNAAGARSLASTAATTLIATYERFVLDGLGGADGSKLAGAPITLAQSLDRARAFETSSPSMSLLASGNQATRTDRPLSRSLLLGAIAGFVMALLILAWRARTPLTAAGSALFALEHNKPALSPSMASGRLALRRMSPASDSPLRQAQLTPPSTATTPPAHGQAEEALAAPGLASNAPAAPPPSLAPAHSRDGTSADGARPEASRDDAEPTAAGGSSPAGSRAESPSRSRSVNPAPAGASSAAPAPGDASASEPSPTAADPGLPAPDSSGSAEPGTEVARAAADERAAQVAAEVARAAADQRAAQVAAEVARAAADQRAAQVAAEVARAAADQRAAEVVVAAAGGRTSVEDGLAEVSSPWSPGPARRTLVVRPGPDGPGEDPVVFRWQEAMEDGVAVRPAAPPTLSVLRLPIRPPVGGERVREAPPKEASGT